MKLVNGTIKIDSCDFPLFLHATDEFDPNDHAAGLLQGPLLVIVRNFCFSLLDYSS